MGPIFYSALCETGYLGVVIVKRALSGERQAEFDATNSAPYECTVHCSTWHNIISAWAGDTRASCKWMGLESLNLQTRLGIKATKTKLTFSLVGSPEGNLGRKLTL